MDQQRIWNHFQGEGRDAFAAAVPRLLYLTGRAAKVMAERPKTSVLNIGIGNGWLERRCRDLGWEVCALDPSEKAVLSLCAEGIDARAGLIESIPFDDGLFDCCFCSEVFEHLTPDQLSKGLHEIRRVLRTGGLLIGTVPYKEQLASNTAVCPDCGKVFHRWGHQQAFDRDSMNQVLASASFSRIDVRVRAFPDFSRKGLMPGLKSCLRWLLGAIGEPIALPNLVFNAIK